MPVNIHFINKTYSETWKKESLLTFGRFYPLFPNELHDDGGAFKAEVIMPLMTLAKKGNKWSQEDGIPLTDSHEKTVAVVLDQVFNVHTKIDKTNVPANPESWAKNKTDLITEQEAEELDEYVLSAIAKGVSTKVEDVPEELNKDTIVSFFFKLEAAAKKQKFNLKNSIIFISPKVRESVIQAKLECVDRNVENTSVVITSILGYNVVSAPIDELGYDFIALPKQAFAWVKANHTPLESYIFTQGTFKGQIATIINEFYGSKNVMPEMIIGVPTKDGETGPSETQILKLRIAELERLNALSEDKDNVISLSEKEKKKLEEEKAELLAKVESLEKDLEEALTSEEVKQA
ncbi:hypothetical protein mflW37_5790 [Mesoplasma florum W37]|uniref:Uncharacterized protein n=1 Tax=Mesoplasma florum TaxID=2151 RepID=A0AAD0HTF0_MESFO|nr:hypothetical protein [Mesoplasma florum]AGY41646.1 hypothetical protein mflW37_5790 [Mesoplasma florum W37]AVN59850.1 hypothetical protein CG008_03065 [Mesoplasma florum]AVN65984.1 hypothetical protein MflW12_5790 [Mesoplasma florum]